MKKLILVMVFVLLTAFFVAFNYLLWEREDTETKLKNLENANAGNNASISAQKREIDSLEERNTRLEDEIKSLGEEKERILTEKQALSEEKDKINRTLQERIKFINAVKQYVDIKVLSEPVTKWAEAVNQGKYKEAYELEFEGTAEDDRTTSQEEYAEGMKNTVRKIEINEVKLDKLRGAGEGEIFLEVRMNVKLADSNGKKLAAYTDGINEKYVKIDYSYEKKAFIISSISGS